MGAMKDLSLRVMMQLSLIGDYTAQAESYERRRDVVSQQRAATLRRKAHQAMIGARNLRRAPDLRWSDRGSYYVGDEYRVWHESGNLLGVTTDPDAADAILIYAAAAHVNRDGCDGCGILTSPHDHGYSVQIVVGDDDVTTHPMYL